MKNRVWTIERTDAIAIFLNEVALEKRKRGVGVMIREFGAYKEAKEYLFEKYQEDSRYDLDAIKPNRLLYADKE